MTSTADAFRPELLVDPAWVWARRDDPDVRLVDCGPAAPWGPLPPGMREEHDLGHIPGSVLLPVHNWIKDPDDPLHVLGPRGFADAMGALGVSEGTTVVAYDRAGGLLAARLWWALAYYGHAAAKVLDGGWDRWAERWPVTDERTVVEPARFVPRPHDALVCRIDELRRRLHEPRLKLLDTRAVEEYVGTESLGNPRAGHIPGAVHLDWTALSSEEGSSSTRPVGEVRTMLSALGLGPDDEVVTYCQGGVRAAWSALILTALGWPHVRLYDASMAEWSRRPEAPMVRSPHPHLLPPAVAATGRPAG